MPDNLGNAIALALRTGNTPETNVVPAKASKKKAGKIVPPKYRDMPLGTFDTTTDAEFAKAFGARSVLVEEFVATAKDDLYDRTTAIERMQELASKIWPSGFAPYDEVQVLSRYLKSRYTDHVYRCMIVAIKALSKHKGRMPAKGGGFKTGKRTGGTSTSPSVWHRSYSSRVESVVECLANVPASKVDTAALRAVRTALKALNAASVALARSIKADKAA